MMGAMVTNGGPIIVTIVFPILNVVMRLNLPVGSYNTDVAMCSTLRKKNVGSAHCWLLQLPALSPNPFAVPGRARSQVTVDPPSSLKPSVLCRGNLDARELNAAFAPGTHARRGGGRVSEREALTAIFRGRIARGRIARNRSHGNGLTPVVAADRSDADGRIGSR